MREFYKNLRLKHKTKKKLLCIIFYFLVFNLSAQDKIAYNDIDYAINKIKEVYAGYKDKINKKDFEKLIREIKASPSKDTFSLISRLTMYFNDKHLVITDKEFRKNIDTAQCYTNLVNILSYFQNKSIKKDELEGFWRSDLNDCIMAIKKVSNRPLIYKGFIIESKSKIINGFCNLTLEKSRYKKFVADYTNITWNYRIFTEAYLKTKKVFITGPYGKWLKMDKYKQGVLENYNEFIYKPSIKVLDQNNILVTMSDFGGKNYLLIDSLVKANKDKISQAKNLIIDIRNNAGGYINCYFPFIPYVCTNNIIHDASYLLCSNEIISDMEETVKLKYNKGDTIKAREYEEELLKMKNKKGDFLFYKGDTLKCSSTNKFPKNVAIITNYACMSAAELMVLDFKQSSKVKIFGERTGGALDYLNFMRVKLPSNRFSFRIATVKRITNKIRPKFDNIGLIPDIEITDNVSDWVEFVKKYYEKN